MTEQLINEKVIFVNILIYCNSKIKNMPRTEKQYREIREKTRKNILSSALRLFSIKGYHGTSVSDIAKEAGISKGLAYNYFKSKQHIVEAIFQQGFEMGKLMENKSSKITDPYEKIKYLIETTFDVTKSNEEFWRLYFSVALQPEIIETASPITQAFANSFIGNVEKIFREIGLHNPHAEARFFAALFDGLGLQFLIDKEHYPFTKMKKFFIEKYSKEKLKNLLA